MDSSLEEQAIPGTNRANGAVVASLPNNVNKSPTRNQASLDSGSPTVLDNRTENTRIFSNADTIPDGSSYSPKNLQPESDASASVNTHPGAFGERSTNTSPDVPSHSPLESSVLPIQRETDANDGLDTVARSPTVPVVSFNQPLDSTIPDDANPRDSAAPATPERPNPQTKKAKFMARMAALGLQTPAQPRSQSVGATNRSKSPMNQSGYRSSRYDPDEADADAEDSSVDESYLEAITPGGLSEATQSRHGGTSPAQSTPKRSTFPASAVQTPAPHSEHRPYFFRSNSSEEHRTAQRQYVSDDDERSRDRSIWKRRGSGWVAASRQSTSRRGSTQEPESSRPNHLRRLTGLAGNVNTSSADPSSSAWKSKSEQGAQKWRQLRANLKLLGRERKKAANKLDQSKSTELVAELLAGSPAALIIASRFQPDEGKRIPVLLEQLKISITDSTPRDNQANERNPIFRIELEYGSGAVRMKWTIHRSIRDFYDLHMRYVAEASLQRFQIHKSDGSSRAKLPRFPRTAFPYFRDFRGLTDDQEEEEDETADEGLDSEGPTPTTNKPSKSKRRGSSMTPQLRRSSTGRPESFVALSPSGDGINTGDVRNLSQLPKSDRYNERARRKLEEYLRSLVRFVMFRHGANRMCRFLELSALGVRLASEGGYHGKEGRLMIQSGKGIDFRRAWRPTLVIQRHRPMWFLVRQSYIVCVDSPAEMNIYDVFLVDSDFTFTPKRARIRDQKGAKEIAKTAKEAARHPQHHALRITNSERKLKLLAKDERQMGQFEESIRHMLSNSEWAKPKRFGSFAPVRQKVSAQWLVDGRDYMWNMSRALSMARDVIYLHNWWISPELYMRRPPAISQKWRLDRLLKQKAEEGVKIFIIVYRNINSTIPIDSEYTKFALLDLHPNIFVQRSPNQVRQNVFFWAHHEKFCVVDNTIVFLGGLDLCYGRWDTPNHAVADDRPTGWEPGTIPDPNNCQVWAGKDFSNSRITDFFRLDEPFEDAVDRTKVGRVPWHDVGMQIVGQPARDTARCFVQRWNYILRQRKPSRPTPFLLPPPDFTHADLEALGLEGTCTIQILRSSGEWSLGTPKTEHSIQNAYCKLIEASEHFVYIENQFFVTSCTVDGTKVRNSIGDALVERIIRAHQKNENWLAIIVIPLMPGFESSVDSKDGGAIRLIMQCQYRSICRGGTSIFERLRNVGIAPEDYISFYSLRAWGKVGPNKALVTEQLYVHAKTMIVDDRHAIIGSANINERSMLGDRDSEVAAVIFDNDMFDSVMGGAPYRVGRFPHTLRMRLMREHLGLDVDHILEGGRETSSPSQPATTDDGSTSTPPTPSRSPEVGSATARREAQDSIMQSLNVHTFNHDADVAQAHNPHVVSNKHLTRDSRVTNTLEHKMDVEGYGTDRMQELEGQKASLGRDTITVNGHEIMLNNLLADGHGTEDSSTRFKKQTNQELQTSRTVDDSGTKKAIYPPPMPPRLHTQELGLTQLSQLPPLPQLDDTDIGGPPLQRSFSRTSAETLNPFFRDMKRPYVSNDCMRDPLNDTFFQDTWNTVAKNNTRLFRQVFRSMPDNEVTTWAQYNAAKAYSQRFAQSQGLGKDGRLRPHAETQPRAAPSAHSNAAPEDISTNVKEKERPRASSDSPPPPRSKTQRFSNAFLRVKSSSSTIQDGENRDAMDEKKETSTPPPDATAPEHVDQSNEKDIMSSPDTTKPNVDVDTFSNRHVSTADSITEKASVANTDNQSLDNRYGLPPRRRRRATTRSSATARPSDALLEKSDAEELMKLVQGNLVEWPYDWLCQEERGGKWLYSTDQMAPIEVYN